MEQKKKSKRTRYILIGSGLGLLGIGGFCYWYFIGRKGTNLTDEQKEFFSKLDTKKPVKEKQGADTSNDSSPNSSPNPAKTERKTFPLRRGDRGELVKRVQNNLIERFGSEILPSGADGIFGKELVEALKSKGYSTTIDKATFDKIVSGGGTADTSTNSSTAGKGKVSVKEAIKIATNIWKSCTLKKLPDLLTELRKLNSTQDYTTVNTLFKTIRTRGVRQTIVNAALSTFDDATSKQMISDQFERIGLKYDGEKWTLSGFSSYQLITKVPTTIQSLEGKELEVPEQTLLGERISEYGGKTRFRTIDGQILCVPSQHIRPL